MVGKSGNFKPRNSKPKRRWWTKKPATKRMPTKARKEEDAKALWQGDKQHVCFTSCCTKALGPSGENRIYTKIYSLNTYIYIYMYIYIDIYTNIWRDGMYTIHTNIATP